MSVTPTYFAHCFMAPVNEYDPFAWNDTGRAFASDQAITEYESELFGPLDADLASVRLDNPYASSRNPGKDLHLPDLDSFHFALPEDADSSEDSNSCLGLETKKPASEEHDVWKIAIPLGPSQNDIQFYSWENFGNLRHAARRPAHISEAGPAIFDASLVQESSTKEKSGGSLRSSALLRSLYHLGLGRASVLFVFDEATGAFDSSSQHVRASGCTTMLSQSFVASFAGSGSLSRKLKKLTSRVIASDPAKPEKIALAHAIQAILLVIEDYLGTAVANVRSLLQLQKMFVQPKLLLELLWHMVEIGEETQSSEALLSRIYEELERLLERSSWLGGCAFEILCLVCRPWLDAVEQWTGLNKNLPATSSESRNVPGFVSNSHSWSTSVHENARVDYRFDQATKPVFIAPEDVKTMFDTGIAFRILQDRQPTHPLCAGHNRLSPPYRLELTSDLEHVQRIVNLASDYEAELKAAIRDFDSQGRLRPASRSTGPDSAQDPSSMWENADGQKQWLDNTLPIIDQLPSSPSLWYSSRLQESIWHGLNAAARHTENLGIATKTSPPVFIPSLSLNPFLNAQARLVHASTLRLLFHSSQLRYHISTLRAYHLLGHGSFLFALTNALFSPDLASAERRQGAPRIGQKMGLQLGHRAMWPPAGSELRLALMGILSESHFSLIANGKSRSRFHQAQERELPGGLSFAIRQLSEAEIEQCIQPDSLHALDFLRLQYTAPPPLDTIITSVSLQRYDVIFRFLLRIVRVQWFLHHQYHPSTSGAGSYARNNHGRPYEQLALRFRFEAHHFVSTMAFYVFNVGVAAPWRRFDAYILALEERFGREDYLDREKSTGASVSAVREMHEMMLDIIMTRLYLQEKQSRVMLALEEVFGDILEFVSLQRNKDQDLMHRRTSEVYIRFRTNVQTFIELSKQRAEKEKDGMARGGASETLVAGIYPLFELDWAAKRRTYQ
ncbi:MAG: hypothetical protein M1821_005381 [Bathelium mastoideum]|nr:MAG: hypothetical protein M1821_005381 [Bathelium mastoideum]